MAVFTLRNLIPNNQIEAYSRNEDGSVCRAGVYSTGGASDLNGIVASGQNAIIVDGGYVFVANPGSAQSPIGPASVSVLKIEKDKLILTDVESSNGPNARSITRHGDLVYVVNGGVYQGLLGPAISVIPQTIQGYRFDEAAGKLTAIPSSYTRTMDAAGDAAQIEFTGDGRHLVLSNRRTTNAFTSGAEPDNLEVVSLNADGVPARIQLHDTGGDTPFGFRVVDNRIYLSMGGATASPNQGGSGVYEITADGGMNTLTPYTHDQGTDTCWNAISRKTDQPYFYTSAFFDSQIGKWSINPDGGMTLLNANAGSSAASGQTNYIADEGGLDMSISVNGTAEYLYVLNNPVPPPAGLPVVRLVAYKIGPTGDLQQLGNSVAHGLVNSGFGLWAL
jgi:6-phosphogluconolactonase (cycloisomerase 2 family)